MANNAIPYSANPPDDTLEVYGMIIRPSDNFRWKPADTDFEAYSGTRADYAIDCEDDGNGDYRFVMPDDVPAGEYVFELFTKATPGTETHATDVRVLRAVEYWDGRDLGTMREIIAPTVQPTP